MGTLAKEPMLAEEHDHDPHLASDSFAPTTRPARVRWDDDDVDPEETTYPIAEPGPAPIPAWVITAGAARQLEHGKLKGGKEAEVFLIERTHGAARNLLAAKRYPVQKLGTELMLEFVGDERSAAPRLADTPLDGASLRDLHTQVVAALFAMVRQGVVHADLSPYNVLVWDGRAVLIDFPQAVHAQDGPDALALLQRDVTNLAGWFVRKGVETNLDELYAQLVAEAFA
jgi:serine/threonine-protein kinase RIO1